MKSRGKIGEVGKMRKVTKLEDYKKRKEEKQNASKFDEGIKEYSDDEFEEMLDYEIDLSFGNYSIYNDEFIEQNAEHIVHNIVPFCSICDSRLQAGDKVDNMWPLEYGHNVCQKCREKLPNKIKDEKIINLNKIELILIEEDFQKVMDYLPKKDIINIVGNKVIPEELYNQIKYQILEMEDDLRL